MNYNQKEEYLKTVQLGNKADEVLEKMGEPTETKTSPYNTAAFVQYEVTEYMWYVPSKLRKNKWLMLSVMCGKVIEIKIAHKGFMTEKAVSKEDIEMYLKKERL